MTLEDSPVSTQFKEEERLDLLYFSVEEEEEPADRGYRKIDLN